MKIIIKTIRTMTAVLMIVAGLLALFTIDNAQDITSLMVYAIIMIMGLAGGIYLLLLTSPELTDLSEFEEETNSILEDYGEETNSIFEDYEKEIKELREENLLLIDRYLTFKSIIKSAKIINEDNKEKYPHLYGLLYNEDLVRERTNLQEPYLDELDRFKEIYN